MCSRERILRSALTLGLLAWLLAACRGESPPNATQTPPVATQTAPPSDVAPPTKPPRAETPEPEVQLMDEFETEVRADASAVFPLEGRVDVPLRIEVDVLEGNVDPVIVLSRPGGKVLATNNSAGPGQSETLGQFQFPADGYYELEIQSAAESGVVGVRIYRTSEEVAVGGGDLTWPKDTLQGTMDRPASYHTFRLRAERGQRFDLWAAALSEGLDLVMELYDPDGELVAARDDNIGKDPYLWNFMPTQSGVYTIVLSNYDENVGDYEVGVAPSQEGGPAVVGEHATVVVSGRPRRSTWLTLEGVALDGIRVDARPLDYGIDITLDLYDTRGNHLLSVNSTESNEAEIITAAQFPFDGTYQLEFGTINEGGRIDYLITPLDKWQIGHGGPVNPARRSLRYGTILGPGTLHVFTWDGQAGDQISAEARPTAGALDLAFEIYDADGNVIASHDDDVGKNPVAEIKLPESGGYVLALRNFGSTLGQYQLDIALMEPPDVTATPNATVPP
jgi:hypothetical protein